MPLFYNYLRYINARLRVSKQCNATGNGDLHICVTGTNKMFLVNRSNAMICARAMELFGFGLGTFSELTEGPVALRVNR